MASLCLEESKVPAGHTVFSWVTPDHHNPPSSHTNFSWWGGSRRVVAARQEGCQGIKLESAQSTDQDGHRHALVHLVNISIIVGQLDLNAPNGPAAFRSRRPRTLMDLPTGLSFTDSQPISPQLAQWRIIPHTTSGGLAKFSLQCVGTGRYLREIDEKQGTVRPCVEDGGVCDSWEAPLHVLLSSCSATGLPAKVKSCSSGRYISLSSHNGSLMLRTTSDRRNKAINVSFLPVPPRSVPVWAWMTSEKAHRSHESLHTIINHREPAHKRLPRVDGHSTYDWRNAEEPKRHGEDGRGLVGKDGSIGEDGRALVGEEEQLVIVARHGLSVANMQRDTFMCTCDARFIDAPLSPQGRRQADALGCMLLRSAEPDLVVCSPLRRALQTCLHAFEGSPFAPRIIVLPLLTECVGDAIENVGRIKSEIAVDCELQCFRHWPNVDLKHVPESNWWDKELALNKENGGRQRQARAFADWLGLRKERRILAFSHWGFIEAFTGRSVSNGGAIIDLCIARVEGDVAPRKWDWVHVRKRD